MIREFTERELDVVGEKSGVYARSPKAPRFRTPVTPKENLLRVLRGETPCWIPFKSDMQSFAPRIFPDNVVTGLVVDQEPPLTLADYGGKGWFDTEWVYVEQVGGATTVPGRPQLTDVNEWKEKLIFPDVSTYGWEESRKANEGFFDPERCVCLHMLTAYWERLMAFMDVEDAAVSMIDEDCMEGVHGLFGALTDLYIKTVDYCFEAYHPEIVLWHDDWGTQRAPFFTVETLDEMIIPHLTRLVSHIHKKEMYFELHSCGMNEQNVPLMIKAGVDMWNGQPMNDKKKLAQLYGRDIMLGVLQPDIPSDAKEAEVEQIAEDFFDTYKDKRIYIDDRAPNLMFAKCVYRLARNYYKF